MCDKWEFLSRLDMRFVADRNTANDKKKVKTNFILNRFSKLIAKVKKLFVCPKYFLNGKSYNDTFCFVMNKTILKTIFVYYIQIIY